MASPDRNRIAAAAGLRYLAAVLLLVAAAPATAYQASYVPASALRLQEFLPSPPASGSPEAAADLEAVRRTVATRTAAAADQARADAEVSVFRFADVLGPGFSPEKLPLTSQLFKAVGRDASQIGLAAKLYWQRPRPSQEDSSIRPLLEVSTEGAYPSGHSMFGCMTAVLLGVLVPEQRPALLARGRAYADNRVVAGVHYPTDVEAGCLSGKLAAAVFLQSEQFRRDLARAGAETRLALGLPPLAAGN